jgi:hypothetical protein
MHTSLIARFLGLPTQHRSGEAAALQSTIPRVGNVAVKMLLIVGLAAVGCRSSCKRTWESRTLSPDSAWLAIAHEDVCEAGMVSDVQLVVELRSKDDARSGPVILAPSGDWRDPTAVGLKWLGTRRLEVSVPNRTTFDSAVSQYKDVAIQVRYEHADAADRARWLAWVKRNKAWLAGGEAGPQPVPPPLPDSDKMVDSTPG